MTTVFRNYTKFLDDIREGRENKKLASSYIMNSLTMKRKKLEVDLLSKNSQLSHRTIKTKDKPFLMTQYKIAKANRLEILPSSSGGSSSRMMLDLKSNNKQNQYMKIISFHSINKLPSIHRNDSKFSFIHSTYHNRSSHCNPNWKLNWN